MDAQEILEAHTQRTVERVTKHQTVLAIQDTTYLIYTHPPATEGLGKISRAKGRHVESIYTEGLVMHTCLAVHYRRPTAWTS